MADSTCDLSKEIAEKYDISIAPLRIIIDGVEYKDREEITPDEFFGQLEHLEVYPTTNMPSPADYLNIMKEAVEKGHLEILCICMSSDTSGAYQAAVLAKQDFYEEFTDSIVKIHIVDSRCMSHGSGWLLIKSAMFREKGMSFDELIEFNETYKTYVKHFLSVDDLGHLIKSGRLTNASAFIGKVLNIKPIMSMRKGKGAIVGKERGRKKVLNHYVREFKERIDEQMTDFIIIGYTSDKSYAQNLKNIITAETDYTGEIYMMQMGVVVGNHVGLGALSLFFMEKDRKRDGLVVNEVHELLRKKNELMKKLKKYK